MPFPILLFFVKRVCVILWTRYQYAAILCSSGWLERKLVVVSVEVGLWKMLMLRQVGLLVIERSRELKLFADSIVGLSWMLLWMDSMYCTIHRLHPQNVHTPA